MPNAKKAYISDGVNWLPLVSGVPDMAGYATTEYVDNEISGVASVTKSSNPPNTPDEGDLWFDSDTQELFIYDSVYWVEVSGGALDLTPYLTQSSASNTYLTQSSASTTYATQIALNNLDALPSQTGNTGKYLTTSGSVASWGTLDLSLYQTKNIDVIAAKTGAYTISSGDQGDLIEANGTFTISVPTDATFNFDIGTQINLLNIGTGVITIAAVSAGTTSVTGTPGLKLRAQWSSATLIKRAANTWVLVGDLSA
jgi:hypothetical protein